MSKLVTIYGGSGFVGRYIARRMAKEGWRVRVAVRRPNEALFVKPYGVVGQVEPVLCNIRDDASVRAALHGADAVVNCVGTFRRGGKNNFEAVQNEGAGRIARLAAAEGVDQSGASVGHRGRCAWREPLCTVQGGRRGGCFGGISEGGDFAPFGDVRHRRQVLQPFCRYGPLWLGFARCRREYAVSARICG